MADHTGRQTPGTTRPDGGTVDTHGTGRTARRRRRRSARATVATVLVLAAGVVVAVAALTGSSVWLTVAGVLAVLLGAAAARIVWSEVLVARRDAAADRARQTEGYAAVLRQRSVEHTAVAGALATRLARSEERAATLRSDLLAADLALHHSRLVARRDARTQRQHLEVLRTEVAVLQQALVDERAAADHDAAPLADPAPGGLLRLPA